MVSDLTTARKALQDLLNTIPNVRAVMDVPQTFTPPVVLVMAGNPYRQRAQAVGRKRIRLLALCLGGLSTNAASEAATEDLAELVADKIDTSGDVWPYFKLDPSAELDQPRLWPTAQNQNMLGIAVNVFCESTRG